MRRIESFTIQDSEDDEDKMLPAESCLDGVLFQELINLSLILDEGASL